MIFLSVYSVSEYKKRSYTMNSLWFWREIQNLCFLKNSLFLFFSSVILKTPVSGKMLPRASSNANSEKPSVNPVTPVTSKDNNKKAVIYVSANGSGKTPSHTGKKAPQKTRQNSAKLDSDSSAKESEDDEEYEIPPPEGATTDKAKLQRLQIRNLKRLREKVKEEEEKLRALKSSSSGSAKIKATSSGTVVYKSDRKSNTYFTGFLVLSQACMPIWLKVQFLV